MKRSVQATYNTNVNYMSGNSYLELTIFLILAQMLASLGAKTEMAGELSAADSMAQLEARAAQIAHEEAAIAAKKVVPAGNYSCKFK